MGDFSRATDWPGARRSVDMSTPAAVTAPATSVNSAASETRWSSTVATALFDSFKTNQFASGGLSVLLLGAGLSVAKTAGLTLVRMIRRRIVVRAEFDSRDDSYRWITSWLAKHPAL